MKNKHDPITLDEAEAVKKWLKYNNMNLARLKMIVKAFEKTPLCIKEQLDLLRLSKKVSAKHNFRGKDGRFVKQLSNEYKLL
jgi:hypothetical protein